MNQLIKIQFIKHLALFIVCAGLFSFTAKMGGDHFEIFLNKKLVLQEYQYAAKGIKSFEIDQSDPNATIDIYYSHCGKTGHARSLIIKDAQDNVLKTFTFPEVTGANKYMSCKVKDIIILKKKNRGNKLKLFYISRELPEGKLLAAISVSNTNALSKR